MTAAEQKSSTAKSSDESAIPNQNERSGRDQDLQQIIEAIFSKKIDHVILAKADDARLLESKGFGVREKEDYHLKDYEVLYLMYNEKLALTRGKKQCEFTEYVNFALSRDENAWTRFLIFRDLRSRGYVVREGFGFPIDFRIYDRGDYGNKAAKYIVFGLNEGKTISIAELKKHVDEMSTMGKEAVVAVVERRGEVIYYKVGKWRPIKPL
ncbi:MAG: tRNA-intron lyase [Nitrososphaerales archaeon]